MPFRQRWFWLKDTETVHRDIGRRSPFDSDLLPERMASFDALIERARL